MYIYMHTNTPFLSTTPCRTQCQPWQQQHNTTTHHTKTNTQHNTQQIPEGYCQISCSRCDCCPTLLNATLAAGLSEFAWALNVTSAAGRTEALSQPGLMATLLAPDDGAMRDLFGKLGGKERILSDAATRDKLAAIVEVHWLPPLPESRAVWTTPFMLPGTKLPGLNAPAGSGGLVTVRSVASDGAIELESAGGATARIRGGGDGRDLYACKGFVNVLDGYLLPAPL